MSFAETVLLGAIAGFTIYLGLPVGRLGRVSDRARVALAMFSVGILAFIFVDVTGHGQEIVGTALDSYKQNDTSLAHVIGLFALLAVGFTAGTAGISGIEQYLRRRTVRPPIAGGEAAATLTADELTKYEFDARRVALRSGMTIAFAIGLHNFAEGLAIGVSAKSGAIGLATVLIIGFGLHNATEGFGIVGPLGDGCSRRASSAADPRSSARSSATRSIPTRSSCASTPSPVARSCTWWGRSGPPCAGTAIARSASISWPSAS
jgi:ZIP family zinc transporter